MNTGAAGTPGDSVSDRQPHGNGGAERLTRLGIVAATVGQRTTLCGVKEGRPSIFVQVDVQD